MDFRSHTVIELSAAVRAGERTAAEIAQSALENVAHFNQAIGAICASDAEETRRQAADVDRSVEQGRALPLAGVPIVVKDLEDAAGFRTSRGSGLHAEDPPATRDSVFVSRLRTAGCVVVGKSNTPAFGHKAETENRLFGPTTNPWNPAYQAGGSSGGTASALAAGVVPLGTGSDGGGSIRIPASVCGLPGFKPSVGRIPFGDGDAPMAGPLTVKAPMTTNVADLVAVLDVCVGPEPTDPDSIPRDIANWSTAVDHRPIPRRIAFSETMGFAEVDDGVARAVRDAVERIASQGVDVVEVPTVWSESPLSPWATQWAGRQAAALGHHRGTPRWDLVDPGVQFYVELGEGVSGAALAQAIDARYELFARLEAVLKDVDVLVTPTIAGRPPRIGQQGTINGAPMSDWAQLTYGLNVSGNPAGTLPIGLDDNDLPVGLQIIGRGRDDIGVLSAMSAWEELLAPIPRWPERARLDAGGETGSAPGH